MVEDILRQVDAMISCKGFGEEGEFKASAKRRTKTCGGKCFSASCPGISQTADDSESEHGPLSKRTRKDIVVVYWISFLDQNQRVLLFTQDERVWRDARKVVGGEQSHLELFVSLHGAGVSLVSESLVELAYLSVCSAPAQWEVRVHEAWKPLTLELAAWLEYRWSSRSRVAELKDYVQVMKAILMLLPKIAQTKASSTGK
ncbi:hypothetical protein HPB49_003228 [Dermacentor silvarum]|uniref:Uncharacterized protein n=1 Tax=Dermacentor silvarum TaxID=543639 RepID=A0ACB8C752_DERSI|nr:hypothetical protein HPB49_003228 [Dermacentor silvarum]